METQAHTNADNANTEAAHVVITEDNEVEAVTRAICRMVLTAEGIKLLPHQRVDLERMVDGTAYAHITYIECGDVDTRGYTQREAALRLTWDRVTAGDSVKRRITTADGAVYMPQRLTVQISTQGATYSVADAATYAKTVAAIAAIAAEIERVHGGRDVYLLLATPEEAQQTALRHLRHALADGIGAEVAGMRVGQARTVASWTTRYPDAVIGKLYTDIEVGKGQKRVYSVVLGVTETLITRIK